MFGNQQVTQSSQWKSKVQSLRKFFVSISICFTAKGTSKSITEGLSLGTVSTLGGRSTSRGSVGRMLQMLGAMDGFSSFSVFLFLLGCTAISKWYRFSICCYLKKVVVMFVIFSNSNPTFTFQRYSHESSTMIYHDHTIPAKRVGLIYSNLI